MSADLETNLAADPSQLASQARRVAVGDLPTDVSVEKRAAYIDKWLRWGQSDSPHSRKQWAFLARDKRLDRDRWALDLWRSIVDREGKNRFAKDILEQRVPWSFYQQRFFGWFLGRFNVQAALAIFLPRWLAAAFHYTLSLVMVAAAFASLSAWKDNPDLPLRTFGGLLVFLVIVGLVFAIPRNGLPLYAYFNSLIPRLAAAVGIGYLFLFSAPHLVQMLNAYEPARHIWIAVAALTSAAWFYLMFHIHRRVEPPLALRALLRRSFSVLVLAVAYSALELLVVAPILFSKPFLFGVPPKDCAVHTDLHRLALCAAIALNLGVVLQLAWDEKPLTEPL